MSVFFPSCLVKWRCALLPVGCSIDSPLWPHGHLYHPSHALFLYLHHSRACVLSGFENANPHKSLLKVLIRVLPDYTLLHNITAAACSVLKSKKVC